ncbi:transmembrane and ubiquitin-like domain-containing protein 1 [Pollicipes pollicipes]|uniref:transmembrane and ubiquitin-like domain-containing protein 1 n=1 Tax=Pollicipes pollicipes TaxID=41117 RepID=UPI001884A60F|nr:transmembrane and ubiquitin-like domain-containing protein 1 [Pollicipes pollicipes]
MYKNLHDKCVIGLRHHPDCSPQQAVYCVGIPAGVAGMTMTLIEGVGDEVTLFFVLVVLAAVACLAWWTTRVAERPLRIQTIIVGQRVIHVDDRGEPTAAPDEGDGELAAPGGPEPAAESEPSCEEDEPESLDVAVHEEGGVSAREDTPAPEDVPSAAEDGPPAVDEDGLVAAEEDARSANEAMRRPEPAPDDRQQLRQRRLAFIERSATELAGAPAAGSGARSEQQTDGLSRTDGRPAESVRPAGQLATPAAAHDPAAAAERQGTPQPADETTAETDGPATAAVAGGDQSITVKLKFLNDTQRLVEGSRAEALADFKRRHFPAETAANRLVRLIFNGRLLPDQETLAQCGLYHNCVVHCHVSAEPRPRAEPAATAAAAAAAPGELDISVLLFPVLTSIVTLVWGVRLRYPVLFSDTAVVLLAALTLLLAGFTAATFLPLERLAGAPPAPRQQHRGR